MDIIKEHLEQEFLTKDYNAFFKDAAEITNFLLVRKYSVFSEEIREDIVQDCMLDLWSKISDDKIDVGKGNIVSFVWKNSSFRILDYFKKKNRRDGIVQWGSYEEEFTEYTAEDKQDSNSFNLYKYSPEYCLFSNDNGEFIGDHKIAYGLR